jgi:hypothetical protein
MSEEITKWLVQEVRDLLDVSSVGLYEFLELLQGPDIPISAADRQGIAMRALEEIMLEPGTQLKRLRWPHWESLGPVQLKDLPPNPWRAPDDDGVYLAVDRSG